jgi:glutamate racemase
LIEEAAGPAVDVIDPAVPVARELRRRLGAAGLLRHGDRRATYRFWTTGAVDEVAPIVGKLWGTAVELQHLAR